MAQRLDGQSPHGSQFRLPTHDVQPDRLPDRRSDPQPDTKYGPQLMHRATSTPPMTMYPSAAKLPHYPPAIHTPHVGPVHMRRPTGMWPNSENPYAAGDAAAHRHWAQGRLMAQGAPSGVGLPGAMAMGYSAMQTTVPAGFAGIPPFPQPATGGYPGVTPTIDYNNQQNLVAKLGRMEQDVQVMNREIQHVRHEMGAPNTPVGRYSGIAYAMESSANPLTIGTTPPRCNCHHCDPYAPSPTATSPNTPLHGEQGRTLHGGNDMCTYGHRRCCGGHGCVGRVSHEYEQNPSNTAMAGCQYCGQHVCSRVDHALNCSHTPLAAEVNAGNANGRNANGENVRNSNGIVSWEGSYLQHSKIPVTDNGGDSAKQDNQVSSTAVTDYLPYGIPVQGDNEVTDAPRWWMPRYAAAVEKQLAENEMDSAQAISTQSSSTTTSENAQNMINHLSEKPSNNPSSNRPVATIPVSISSGPLTRVEQILSTPPEHQAMGFSSPSARKADEDTSMWSMSSPNILEARRDEPFLHGEHQQDQRLQEGEHDTGPCLQEQRVEASSSQQIDDSSGDLNVLKHKLSHFEMLADHWQRSCMASERENQKLRQKLKILHTEQFRMDHLD